MRTFNPFSSMNPGQLDQDFNPFVCSGCTCPTGSSKGKDPATVWRSLSTPSACSVVRVKRRYLLQQNSTRTSAYDFQSSVTDVCWTEPSIQSDPRSKKAPVTSASVRRCQTANQRWDVMPHVTSVNTTVDTWVLLWVLQRERANELGRHLMRRRGNHSDFFSHTVMLTIHAYIQYDYFWSLWQNYSVLVSHHQKGLPKTV